MNSKSIDRFWKLYTALPSDIKRQARSAFHRFQSDPYHPGLHFKRVHSTKPIYSVRVSRDYRAVGVIQDDDITWFWIGSHEDYDRLIKVKKHA